MVCLVAPEGVSQGFFQLDFGLVTRYRAWLAVLGYTVQGWGRTRDGHQDGVSPGSDHAESNNSILNFKE